MPDTVPVPDPVVSESRGRIVANSLDVATFFGKSHKNVIRDIRDLIAASQGVCRLNFEPTSREVAQPNGGTRLEPAYDMDRDGFALLGMGFTGAKAIAFKLRYIEAFNAMETALKGRTPIYAPPDPAARAAMPAAEYKMLLSGWNTAIRGVAEIRRCCGIRTAAKAAPEFFSKVGIPIDLGVSDTLRQGELDLDRNNVVTLHPTGPAK
jgi:Rha family phage regulatory protein